MKYKMFVTPIVTLFSLLVVLVSSLLMDSITLFSIGVTLLCVLLAFLCVFWWKKTQFLLDQLRRVECLFTSEYKGEDTPVIGHYYHNILTGVEEISFPLRRHLHLEPLSDRLASLKSVFSAEAFGRLDDLHIRLQEVEQEALTEGDASLLLENFSVEDGRTYLQCYGHQIWQNGALHAVVIWFYDVTGVVRERNRLYEDGERLRREVKRFSDMINGIPFPVWVRDDELNILYCNMAYSALVQQGTEQLLGSSLPELDKKIKNLAERAKEKESSLTDTYHMVFDGERHMYEVTENPMMKEDIQLGVAVNMTRQEEIERELQRHISAQSDLLESSSSAMAIYGADTRLKFFNQAFVKLWGLDEFWLSQQHPTYDNILEVLREERLLPEQVNFPAFKKQQASLFTDLMEPYNEFFYLPDGRTLRVLAIPHALGGVLFAYEDMTDRLALERSYHTLTAVQRATLDNLSEAVAVFSQKGTLTLFNPQYVKMWEMDPDKIGREPHITQVIEMAKTLYTYDTDWETFKCSILALAEQRQPCTHRLERTDGSVVDRTCIPLPDGAILMTYVDVTDSTLVERSLRERNKALQDADRIKTEFLANVSYELRSPLTSIMGLSEALNKQYFGGLNDRQREYVEGIFFSSHQLMSLINDILDLASIEAGFMKLDIERFDIYSALSGVVGLVRERIKESQITFSFECEKDVGFMNGDERRIRQIVLKLLSNAITYTEQGGEITLGVTVDEEKEQEIIIWVKDTGVGIASDEKKEVFEKFYRTESSKLTQRSGTGLGLSIVKNFVELHGGHVVLESEVGVGTTINCVMKRDM